MEAEAVKDAMSKALEGKAGGGEPVYVAGVRVFCTVCAAAIGNLQAAGGKILVWKCAHRPRIVMDTKPYTVVWVRV
jgi:hypothetical protein